jgi:hypothetical protein
MTTYAEITEKATTQFLSAVKPVEEFTKSITDSAVATVSKLPSLPTIPGTEAFPTQLELVTGYFAFAEQVLHAQKDFAVRLASAASTPAKPAAKATKS